MSSRTPGASTAFPSGQLRQGFGRNWGNYVSAATLPNASGNALSLAHFTLEEGDCAWVVGDQLWECIDPGTAGGTDALWIRTEPGPSNVLYVDGVYGNDLTGKRGSMTRPYLTIQAALDAMQSYDIVQLAPQQFDLSASLTVPATVEYGGLRGWGGGQASAQLYWWGEGDTILHGVGGTVVLDFSTLGLKRFNVSDIDIWNDNETDVISMDGSAYTVDTYLTDGGLSFYNCSIVGGIFAKYAQYVQFYDCALTESVSGIVLTSCWHVGFSKCFGPTQAMTITFDATDPLAPTFQNMVSLTDGTVIGGTGTGSFVEIGGQGRLYVDQTSVIGGLRGNNLAVAGGFAPGVVCSGSIAAANVGVVDFYSAAARRLPDSATACVFDFRGCRFFSAEPGGTFGSGVAGPSVIGFQIDGAAANPQSISMDDSEMLPGVSIVCGTNVSISARSAQMDLPIYTISGTGAIATDRSLDITFAVPGSGTTPVVEGAIYLRAGSYFLPQSNALVGTAAGGTGTVQLRRQGTGVLVAGASWAVTATGLADVALAAVFSIAVSDWYTVELVGDVGATVPIGYGLRLVY